MTFPVPGRNALDWMRERSDQNARLAFEYGRERPILAAFFIPWVAALYAVFLTGMAVAAGWFG